MKVMRQTSVGLVLIEAYEDEKYVTLFDEEGWSTRDGPHGGELWEALFYVAGVDEQEARAIQADVGGDARYEELVSGAKNIPLIPAIVVVFSVLALLVLGVISLIQLVF
jgi:hypothetical protein